MKWLILILGITANTAASILIKMAMTPPRQLPSFEDPWAELSNWPLWLGLGLYGLAFLTYAASLARLPLHVVHPVMTSGAIAAVALLSVLIFKEPFNWITGLGLIFVVTGVGLITVHKA